MGWFGDLWSGIKNIAGKVYDTVRKPVDWIAGAGDILRKVPVVGGALDAFLSPITGTARAVQGGLNTARDIVGVGTGVGKAFGLQHGGMVPGNVMSQTQAAVRSALAALPMKKMYQA